MSKTNTLLKRIQSRHSRGSDGLGGSSEFIVLAVFSLETNTNQSLVVLRHGRHKGLADSTSTDKLVAPLCQPVHHNADWELRFVERPEKFYKVNYLKQSMGSENLLRAAWFFLNLGGKEVHEVHVGVGISHARWTGLLKSRGIGI